jgi:hypothetical protein
MQEIFLEQQNTSNQPLTHLTESIPAASHTALFEQKLFECYAERIALSVRQATNFTQSLLQQHLASDITLLNRRGQPLTLHGKDICNEGTWHKFLTAAPLVTQQLCSLVEGTETITRRYRSWLLTSYTQRYKHLVQPAHLTWFHHVTRLAVIWHIMEAKAQHSAFVDPWVAQEMEALKALGTLATEVAKAIHHIIKEPKEEAPRLLEHLYLVHAAEITRPRLAPHPLPALPEGVHPPLALLPKSEPEQMGLPDAQPEETAQ